MASWCRVITAAVFATHLLMGCCAHHVHAYENSDACSHSSGAAAHDTAGQHSQCDCGPHGHGCHGSTCSFILSSQTGHTPAGQDSTTFVVPLADDLFSRSDMPFGRRAAPPGRYQMPGRLYLANQVLLI